MDKKEILKKFYMDSPYIGMLFNRMAYVWAQGYDTALIDHDIDKELPFVDLMARALTEVVTEALIQEALLLASLGTTKFNSEESIYSIEDDEQPTNKQYFDTSKLHLEVFRLKEELERQSATIRVYSDALLNLGVNAPAGEDAIKRDVATLKEKLRKEGDA